MSLFPNYKSPVSGAKLCLSELIQLISSVPETTLLGTKVWLME